MQKNFVKFWKILKNDLNEDDNEYIPKPTARLPQKSSVTGLEFIDFNNAVVTSDDGSLRLVYVNRDREEANLRENFSFRDLHKFSCTGVSVLDDDTLVTVGDDGAFNVISVLAQKVIKSNKSADSAAISCCSFVSGKELLTGNNFGAIKIFDISASDKPVTMLNVSSEDEKRCTRVTSITFHPTQIHIVLAATEEGSISVFDLRQTSVPASYLSAHMDSINEIGFHRSEPSKLFTCAENGDLWQWQTQSTYQSLGGAFGMAPEQISPETPWLNGERAKNSITVSPLVNGSSLAINSFDSFKNKVVAAGDNECIYLIDQLY